MTSQGNQAATLKRTSTGFNKQSGKFIQKRWEGTEDAINAVEAEVALTADDYTKEPEDGAKWSLTARFGSFTEEGTEETPTSEERLRFNQSQKDIRQNLYFVGLNKALILEIEGAVENREPLPQPTTPEAQALYNLLVSGVNSFNVYQPVVVVTDTASANYPWNIGFADYGKIFTTTEMIADADLNSGWKANLPGDGSPPSGFLYGWLKKPPEIVTVAGNKTQLVQEYEYGLWSDVLYD